MISKQTILSFAGILVLTSCAISPAYHKPQVFSGSSYLPADQKLLAQGDGAPEIHSGQKVPVQWWHEFKSNELDFLIRSGLKRNPNIKATSEALMVARENLRAAEGVFYPQVNVDLGAQRTRDSGAGLGSGSPKIYSLYTGNVNVSYSPDIFGLNHLVAREGQAQVNLAEDQMDAARLTLEGNIAQTYFNLVFVQKQIELTRKTIAEEASLLKLVETRFHYGAVSDLDVLSQKAVLDQTKSQLPKLLQNRDADEHLLAIYTGKFPSQVGSFVIQDMDMLDVPSSLPLRVPSRLVQARPDIRAAEASLRVANAQVGIAIASMYPNFTLSASYGGKSENFPSMFDPAGRIWSLASDLAAPIFEGGTLLAQKRAAEATYREIFDQYRSVSLDAFRQVADVLRALNHDAQTLAADESAMVAAKNVYILSKSQYEQGSIDELTLLNAETQYENTRLTFLAAKQARLNDSVAFYVAMGGGMDIHRNN
ncbi:MAG: efflux transporter outer membrane subunit [Proteobacteria bacterium]|nr:efflux transporter outer membrane subunit [Pseudomonadota bacterium]